ncbi:MAG TPA: carbon storage regulator [Pirellulales bacterium]|jgi:carbon storage regulator|nr:carbon storage regulator [Pirellulales bacterium]
MLVLSRKVGEKLVIGDGIVITVSRVAGQRVSIGIEAPPHVRVVRGELQPYDHPENPEHADAALACSRG